MKNLICVICVLLSFAGFAQIKITNIHTNEELVNNQEYVFGKLSTQEAELPFKIENTGNTPVYLRIRCDELINTNGQRFSLCYEGQCPFNTSVGQLFPNSNVPTPKIEAGQVIGTNGENHFLNSNSGINTNELVKYKFTFVKTNSAGTPQEDVLTIVYVYDPHLSIATEELSVLGITINNSIVTDFLSLTSANNVTANLYDLNGKFIKTFHIGNGVNNLDCASLPTGLYVMNINDNNGRKASVKILKK